MIFSLKKDGGKKKKVKFVRYVECFHLQKVQQFLTWKDGIQISVIMTACLNEKKNIPINKIDLFKKKAVRMASQIGICS